MLQLELSYRPPLTWSLLLSFWQCRTISGLEWCDGERYGRLIDWPPGQGELHGWFEVRPQTDKHALALTLYWPDAATLWHVVRQIRRLLDLDADPQQIDQQLGQIFGDQLKAGLRIPGVWSVWEAGVRAILGQQVSVAGALTQLQRLVQLGTPMPVPEIRDSSVGETAENQTEVIWRQFPTPAQLKDDPLEVIKVPQARRATLQNLAQLMHDAPETTPDQWLPIKGIGPWTVAYSKMRGLSEPDIWLGGDLGIQKALARQQISMSELDLKPWRSYATLQLWFGLAD